jgi:copper resistance protein B
MRNATAPCRGAWPTVAALAAPFFSGTAAAQHDHQAPAAAPPPQTEHAEHAVSQSTTVPGPTDVTEAARAAAFPELGAMRMSDMMLENPLNKLVLLDRLEWHDAPGNPQTWDLDAWIGRDLAKLWIRSEGERRNDDTEHAEVEILWGKTFARWWDFVAGARYDAQPSPDQSWAAFGVRGLAPYRFDIEATAYVGESGHTALRFETQYDLLITNRLLLQPQLELDWYGQSDPNRGIGAGLAEGELGLRLRYEFRREVAPYVGLVRARKFGRTADFATGDTDDTRLVAGIRLWF